jgi:hypothetical protein
MRFAKFLDQPMINVSLVREIYQENSYGYFKIQFVLEESKVISWLFKEESERRIAWEKLMLHV